MNRLSYPASRRMLVTAVFTILCIGLASHGCTSTPKPPAESSDDDQQTFASPDEAVTVLVSALRSMDSSKLQAIFGKEGSDLLSSGDPISDRQTADRFLRAFDEKHRLTTNDDGSVTIVVGNADWPMPIPIVRDDDGKGWVFDTATGREEIINRRIGRNELDVIETCKAICDAQAEYAGSDPDGDGVPAYARKFISDPGKRNGLFWPTEAGQAPSPLGPFIAEAAAEGYSAAPHVDDEPRPYHGYFYRIVTAQGPNAPGGAMDYVVGDKLLFGFAVVAWPAEYGNSGIMTFIVNYDGVVYQRDLGNDTDKTARAMTAFDPGPGWTKSE
jgi:Protein of unknown function (DUF2950)